MSKKFEILDLTRSYSLIIARDVNFWPTQSLWAVQVLLPNCILIEV